ncbi:MAG: Zn-ribbon domain-containing OB-fold protein [Thaumarchaeota archaeon]|nr:Zn-ribbon domain-containing OB-fold protein [Nitrososphaerota archaeon]
MDSGPPTLHSRRTLTLRFNVPISRTHQFWDSLREGRFVTTRCGECGALSFPPQSDCARCMSGEVEWVDLGTEAELVTFTYVQVTPPSFVEDDPYIVGIGRMSQGLKILAWVEGTRLEALAPGMKLKLEPRTSDDGSPYYVFVPAP